MELLNLAERISECATKIGNVTENLAIALGDFNQGRMELRKGFQELSKQIKSTAHCITTMTSGVSFQSGEITKLLKAFDRWAATGRWVLAGSQTVKPDGGDQHPRSPRTFLCCFAVLLCGRNANLAGGFAGRFLVVVLVVWFVSRDDLPEILDHTSPVHSAFHCLRNCKDRAQCESAKPEGKKNPRSPRRGWKASKEAGSQSEWWLRKPWWTCPRIGEAVEGAISGYGNPRENSSVRGCDRD